MKNGHCFYPYRFLFIFLPYIFLPRTVAGAPVATSIRK